MRDCVRRFAEAMDAVITEKEALYGPVEGFIKKTDVSEMIGEMDGHAAETGVTELGLRQLIHTANYGMMAWNKQVVFGG